MKHRNYIVLYKEIPFFAPERWLKVFLIGKLRSLRTVQSSITEISEEATLKHCLLEIVIDSGKYILCVYYEISYISVRLVSAWEIKKL